MTNGKKRKQDNTYKYVVCLYVFLKLAPSGFDGSTSARWATAIKHKLS